MIPFPLSGNGKGQMFRRAGKCCKKYEVFPAFKAMAAEGIIKLLTIGLFAVKKKMLEIGKHVESNDG